MQKGKEIKVYKTYLISVSLVLVFFLAAIFSGIVISVRTLIHEEILIQARAYFDQIVIARKWNAGYNGVYVEKAPGMVANPYLQDPDIRTTDGKVYTKKNPALMMREISEIAERKGLVKFRITSLRPVNPLNKPDDFEKESLELFQEGQRENFKKEMINNRTHFRYMGPLFIEKACLQCHGNQGYREGDIRGGISVSFDIQPIESRLRTNVIIVTVLGVCSILLLLGVVYFFTFKMIRKIAEIQKKVELMAITDELTGMFNRRHVMARFREEFEKAKRHGTDLGCIMIDVDNFKTINDTWGHLEGDRILKEVGKIIQRSVRVYDIPGRFGGEEFIIVLPGTGTDETQQLAERIRTSVRTQSMNGKTVTVSLGTTCLQSSDPDVDTIIKRADDNLYGAKKKGRDIVEST